MTRSQPRRRALVGSGVALAVLATGTGVLLTRLPADHTQAEAQAPTPPATTRVARTDLVQERKFSGTIAYGPEKGLTGRRPGTVTMLPDAGKVLERGASVYSVDARPVPLFYADTPLYRDLAAGMTDGADVLAVEQNLKALGFGGFGTPDKKFTEATAAAITKWQRKLGLTETGVVGMADVVISTGPIRVAAVVADQGDQGTVELMKYTGTARVVTVPVKDQDKSLIKVGTKLTLTASGRTTTGTVTALGSAGGGGPGGGQDAGVSATVVPDDPGAVGDAESVAATVTSQSRKGVLAVPVGALVALVEGGLAVEVVEGGGTRLVPVTTGLYASGKVEITGPGLAEGTTVVTTS
ncbi:peptidoglycan-binding protein [Actinokineospora sp. HUAS TT18]|uniref:peptidoglycan-binding protein n=1 Tax=Actinokineospora sp. HUAS TT18 TaxID=3447451 RepID=UPI003F521C49